MIFVDALHHIEAPRPAGHRRTVRPGAAPSVHSAQAVVLYRHEPQHGHVLVGIPQLSVGAELLLPRVGGKAGDGGGDPDDLAFAVGPGNHGAGTVLVRGDEQSQPVFHLGVAVRP